MTTSLMVIMVLYAVGMACGQLLFKLAAMASQQGRAVNTFFGYLSPYLIGGVILYGLLTLLWVWILRSVPLSRAYPFVALSFVFTPVLSKFVLNESLSVSYIGGLALIIGGVLVIVRG